MARMVQRRAPLTDRSACARSPATSDDRDTVRAPKWYSLRDAAAMFDSVSRRLARP